MVMKYFALVLLGLTLIVCGCEQKDNGCGPDGCPIDGHHVEESP